MRRRRSRAVAHGHLTFVTCAAYLLADAATKEGVIIDPVLEMVRGGTARGCAGGTERHGAAQNRWAPCDEAHATPRGRWALPARMHGRQQAHGTQAARGAVRTAPHARGAALERLRVTTQGLTASLRHRWSATWP